MRQMYKGTINREKETINWATALIDIAIMIMAIIVSVWQDNPNYLWLLVLLAFSGGYKLNNENLK